MFNVLLMAISQPPRRARWLTSVGAAALHFSSLSGCALDERPGDGVVTDGLQVTVSPTVAYDAGAPEVDADLSSVCKASPVFHEKAVPQLAKHCALDCHDATKQRATQLFDLQFLKTKPEWACAMALLTGIRTGLSKKSDAPILTFSDPSRDDIKHDFKFKTAAEFNAFRDEIMPWISAELPDIP